MYKDVPDKRWPSKCRHGIVDSQVSIEWHSVQFNSVQFSHSVMSDYIHGKWETSPTYQPRATRVLSCFSHVQLLAPPWIVARQAPVSMGILQASILEWVAISFSRGSSQPRDRTQVSRIGGRRFNLWSTREAAILTTRHITGSVAGTVTFWDCDTVFVG